MPESPPGSPPHRPFLGGRRRSCRGRLLQVSERGDLHDEAEHRLEFGVEVARGEKLQGGAGKPVRRAAPGLRA